MTIFVDQNRDVAMAVRKGANVLHSMYGNIFALIVTKELEIMHIVETAKKEMLEWQDRWYHTLAVENVRSAQGLAQSFTAAIAAMEAECK